LMLMNTYRKLEEIGLPKKAICAELVQHIRFAKRTLIYETLGPEYKRDYNNESTLNEQVDDNKEIEEDSKKVAQNYNIDMEKDIPDSPVYDILQEKIQMITDERDYYIDLCNQLKEEVKILKQQLQLL
jgi:hypothetical protein